MKVLMTVYCGTRIPKEFTIDLDDYGINRAVELGIDKKDLDAAYELLKNTMSTGKWFAGDGHRNHSAVNSCIALHVLGYYADEWLEVFCKEQEADEIQWRPYDLKLFMEHVDRVVPYLSSWGPDDNRAAALGYALN